MTKKEIVRQIAERIHETQLKTKDIVQLTFDAIVDTLIVDRRIELRNFGVFEVKLRKSRRARNPRTNAPVDVPPKFVVTFKPGKEMEERVRRLTPSPAELAALQKRAAAAAAARTAAEMHPPQTVSEPTHGDGANGMAEPTSDTEVRKKRPRKASTAQV